MARLARLVGPGVPHHITQRGNRRQRTFFCDEDYVVYVELMAVWCFRFNVEVWAYCLMPNHVHLIAVPSSEDGLRRAIGEAHRRYSRRINFREGWRGHLWQGRFASYPMDERYLLAAARYVELNPVRAGLVKSPGVYPWSSAAAHLTGRDDMLVKVAPLLGLVENWVTFLAEDCSDADSEAIRRHERTGRPLGNDDFLSRLELALERSVRPGKPGPKRLEKGSRK
ncbi:MAG: transposase [Ignavibacteriales bacterium]|nr:transposase [Ignavibacteriales bacterium]